MRWAVVLAGMIGLGAALLGAAASAAERSMACTPPRGMLLLPLPPDDAGSAGRVGNRLIAARMARGLCIPDPRENGPAVYRRIIDTSDPELLTLRTARLALTR